VLGQPTGPGAGTHGTHTADCTCIPLVCVCPLTTLYARPSLSLPEQVEALVNYIVNEPAEDASDKLKFVYPYKVTPLPVSPPQRLPVGCLLCSRACAPAFPLAFACSFRMPLHHKAPLTSPTPFRPRRPALIAPLFLPRFSHRRSCHLMWDPSMIACSAMRRCWTSSLQLSMPRRCLQSISTSPSMSLNLLTHSSLPVSLSVPVCL
jgi:hypothetical protein